MPWCRPPALSVALSALLLLFLLSPGGSAAAGAAPELVMDFTPGIDHRGRLVGDKVRLGDKTLLVITDDEHGDELWSTDHTAAGTHLLKDIFEGPGGSDIDQMTVSGGKVFFIASDPTKGRELWISDGTPEGTRLVADLMVSFTSYLDPPRHLKAFGGGVLFTAASDITPRSLWFSDGTQEGTRCLRSMPSDLNYWEGQVIGSQCYLAMNYDMQGDEIWKTDDTAQGTVLVKTLPHDPDDGNLPTKILGHVGSTVFFEVGMHAYAHDLWKTNGTPAGTVKVTTLNQPQAVAGQMIAVGKKGYFLVHGPSNITNIWVTDGTARGTKQWSQGLGLFAEYIEGSFNTRLRQMGNNLVAPFYDGSSGSSLWSYNLATGEPTRIFTTRSETSNETDFGSQQVMTDDGRLFFSTFRGSLGVTDGTLADTRLLRPAAAQDQPISFSIVTALKDSLLLSVRTAQPQVELWTSDGTDTGTQPFFSLPNYAQSSTPHNLRIISGRLHFRTWDTAHQYRDWQSDGTAAGTVNLPYPPSGTADPGVPAPNPQTAAPPPAEGQSRLLGTFGAFSYYQVLQSTGHYDLVSIRTSDGGQTRLFRRVCDPQLHVLAAAGGTMFFSRREAMSDLWTVWQTSGTAASTVQIALSTRPGSEAGAAILGDRLFFSAWQPDTGEELYALDLTGGLQMQEVTAAPHPALLAPGAALEFIGTGSTRTLRLVNVGGRSLGALTLTPVDAAAFQISPLSLPALAPGASAEVQITLQTSSPGTWTGRLDIALAAGGSGPLSTVTLTGRLAAPGSAPEILRQPVSRVALSGQPVTFSVSTLSAEPLDASLSHWQQDGSDIPDQGETSLTLAAMQPGIFTFTAGTVQGSMPSQPAHLAVVSPLPATFGGALGKGTSVTCTARAPAGSTLTYQWLRNGRPLADMDRFQGTRTATLQILAVQTQDALDFTCLVTHHAPDGSVETLSAGPSRLIVLNRPNVLFPVWINSIVGQDISYQILSDQPVDSFTVKGLPPGLKVSRTGLITGRPTKALPDGDYSTHPYIITATATNAGGTGVPAQMQWFVWPPVRQGSYAALFDRAPGLDGGKGLGSQLQLTVTGAGSLSGQLRHAGKTYRLAPPSVVLSTDTAGYNVDVTLALSIPRGKDGPPLTLTLVAQQAIREVRLSGPGAQETHAPLHPHLPLVHTRGLAMTYPLLTCALNPPQELAGIPRGSSYFTVTLGKSGIATWKGRLADGTALTGSTNLLMGYYGSPYMIPFHADLYQATGSLHGLGTMAFPQLPGELTQITGDLTWLKAPQHPASRDRAYKGGIPLHTLPLHGGEYRAPASGSLIFGLPASSGHITLSLSGADFPEGTLLSQDILLPPKSKAVLAAPVKTLTFAPKTGTYKGTLEIPGPVPALKRTVPFEGVLLYPVGPAPGFFLLPDLPADGQPVSALKSTPIQSASIQILPRP